MLSNWACMRRSAATSPPSRQRLERGDKLSIRGCERPPVIRQSRGSLQRNEGDMASAPASKRAARVVRLGKYEVVEHIATGGMGAVYKAREVQRGRIVAV